MRRLLYLVSIVCLLPGAVGADPAESPLADALEQKNRKAARKLLEQKSDVNAAQVDGMTPLHWAAYHDDVEIAQHLLEAGARPDAGNRYGVTPLYCASQNGNATLVKALLHHGADPNTSLQGEEVLLTASRTGSADVVKALIEAGARLDARDHNRQTALMWAAAEGNLEVVELLIKAGADIREQLDSGFTPMLFAVREGRSAVAHAFLEAGIDIDEAATAPKRGRLPAGSTALTLAIENGHFALAASFLEAGANPNEMRTGFTPLHMLSWVRKPDGGDGPDDLPPPDGSGNMTSLQFAKILVDHGAEVNARLRKGPVHWRGGTPFYLAAWTADVALMRILVELGADPLINASDGSTPLMAATGIGRKMEDASAGTESEVLASVTYLLELGVDIDAVNNSGETAMHGAAYKNLPGVVTYLDRKGADVNTWHRRNKRGSTPYLIAAGYRPGNFKPSYETMTAFKEALARHGMEPVEKPPERIDPYAQKQDWDKPKQK